MAEEAVIIALIREDFPTLVLPTTYASAPSAVQVRPMACDERPKVEVSRQISRWIEQTGRPKRKRHFGPPIKQMKCLRSPIIGK